MTGLIDTLLIAGPTASGKSAVALGVARAADGVVINADSMQIYRELPILSAQPSADEQAAAPHRLFGMVSAYEPFSVARWLEMARREIGVAHEAGRIAIVTGGTGLYFKALLEGLAEAPASDPAVRAEARARREAIGAAAFHAELVALAPASARLAPGDTQRVLRAWEVARQSGRALSDFAAAQDKPPMPATWRALVLDVDRPVLNARINARFEAMMTMGAMAEAEAFWSRHPDPHLPSAKALGLPSLKQALDGTLALEDAVADATLKTRRFAKRQSTWFRNQTADWARLDATGGDSAALSAAALAMLSP